MSHDTSSTDTTDDSTDKLFDVSRRTFLGITGAAATATAIGASSENTSAASTQTWNVHDWMQNHGVSADRAVSQIIGRAEPGDTVLFPAVNGETWYTIHQSHQIRKPLTLKGEDGVYLKRTSNWLGFQFHGPGRTGEIASMTGSVSKGDTTIPVDTGAVNFRSGDYVQIRNERYWDAGADGGTHEYPLQFAEVTGVGNGSIDISNEAYFDYSPAHGQVEKVELLEGATVENLSMVGDNNDPNVDYMSNRSKTRGMFEMRWVKNGVYRDCSIRNYFSIGFYFFDCWDVVWDHVEAYDAQSKAPGKGEGIKAGHCTGVKAFSPVHKNCRRGVDIGNATAEVLVKNPVVENASLIGVGNHNNTDSYVAGRLHLIGGTLNAAGTNIDHISGETVVEGTKIKTSGNGIGIAGDDFTAKNVSIEGIDGGSGYGVFINGSPDNVYVHGEITDNADTFQSAAVIITPDGDIENHLYDLDITSNNRFYGIGMTGNTYKDLKIRGTLDSSSQNSDIAIHGTYQNAGVIDGLDISVDLNNHGGPGAYFLVGDQIKRLRIHDSNFDLDGDYGIWLGYHLDEEHRTEIDNVSLSGSKYDAIRLESQGSAYIGNIDTNSKVHTSSDVDLADSSYDYSIDVGQSASSSSSRSGSSSSGASISSSDSSGSSSGSTSSGSSGVSLSGQNHTMSVVGTGSATDYKFTVAGSIDPDSNVESSDTVSGKSASGTVKWQSDNYNFTGDITSFDVVSGDDSIDIWIDGSKYSPSDFSSSSGSSGSSASGSSSGSSTSSGDTGTGATHKIEIVGTKAEVSYTFDVSGSIEWSKSVESNDDVGTNSVSGQISIASDTFGYSGELKSFKVTDGSLDDVKVYIDGKRQFPDDLANDWHTLQIQGTGPVTRYSFDVSGQVDPKGTLETNDTIHSTSANGQVSTGSDTYSFAGSLDSFTVTDGSASDIAVYVDGNRRTIDGSNSSSSGSNTGSSSSPSAGPTRDMSITGTGTETKYRFTVSGSVSPHDNVESIDNVSGSTVTGTTQWMSDNYTYTGKITSFEVLSGDDSIDIWIAGDKHSPSDFPSSPESSGSSGSGSSSSGSGSSSDGSKLLKITNGGTSTATYEFNVTGSVSEYSGTEKADWAGQQTSGGSIAPNDYDTYTFTGSLHYFDVLKGNDQDVHVAISSAGSNGGSA